MASSRFMRNSPRTASPLDVAMTGSSTPERNIAVQQEVENASDGWIEPPLRAPAPSFEDHKGLERHGVLEHMAPLGAMPNQKVKQRVKQNDSSRRSQLGKYAEAAASTKEPSTAPELPVRSRRSESRKIEDRASRTHATRDKDDDQDYTPKAPILKPTTAKTLSSRNSVATPPSSRTTAGQERLRLVVDSAVERSRELGNELLGLAVRRLFEESLQNRTLAELLDAVLSQKPTNRQATDFQAYIKIARKQIKAENNINRRSSNVGPGSSSKSTSKSPSKSVGPSVARPTESAEVSTSIASHSSPSFNGRASETNGIHDEHRTKRLKRSKSVSSTSSLSSLSSTDPAIEIDQNSTNTTTGLSSSTMVRRGTRTSNGPKLHTFATGSGRATSRRSAAPVTQPSDVLLTDQEMAAKRQKLQKTFDDVTVEESNLRTAITATEPAGAQPNPAAPLSVLTSHSFRSGRAGRRDDYDDLRSSASSTQGDFLVPPPPGAQRVSRGATPNQQAGGPKKEVRKGARIKNSPMKKKTGVVAGIAQKSGGKDGAVGYGQTGDNGDIDNVDFCTACGGNGQLLCCDGCPRSFHFKCLDPPMNPRQPPDGTWFCHICVSSRDPQPSRPRGLFAALLGNLDKQNPIAFNLPPDIRDHFENVQTGEDGEYMDTTLTRSKPREGGLDNLKIHDSKGNPILCFKCGKSALGHREIIACDYCPNRWHLDCLDPPLTYPPSMTINWKCPAHFDQDLLNFKNPGGDRVFKVRRPKRPRIIDSALSRGLVNNGTIEICSDRTDDEEEMDIPGSVYRIPEKSVKLDFIDRCRRERAAVAARPTSRSTPNKRKATAMLADTMSQSILGNVISSTSKLNNANQVSEPKKIQEAFNGLGAKEKDAVLTLLHLCQPDISSSHHQNSLQAGLTSETSVYYAQNLVAALMAQAPHVLNPAEMATEVKHEPSVSPPRDNSVSATEKQYLLMIQEVIRRRLDGSDLAN